MKRIIFLLILMISIPCISKVKAQKRDKFSAVEVKDDLKFLYETLEASHFDLYTNTPKRVFVREYREINEAIKDSLTMLQINRLFQPFVALSKLGHCVTGYPFRSYNAFRDNGGKVFPFDVRIEKGRIFITGNYSSDTTLQKGDEIIAMYGLSTRHWLDGIYRYLSGENETFKNTLVDLIGFPRLYWMIYGESKVYSMQIKKLNGQRIYINDAGMLATSYRDILNSKPGVFNVDREFKIMPGSAYLHPGQFLNSESGNIAEHKAFEKGEFIHFIDSAFNEIHKNDIESLILDLRGNPGGDNTFSDPMIAYFADKPFYFASAFDIKTSRITKNFWKDVNDTSLADIKRNILTKNDGETFSVEVKKYPPRTDSLRFRGRVYVLVDRYTYSNATTVAAIIQDYNFGFIVGEATADSPTTYAAIHEFNLPNTDISVTYPKAFIVRPNGDKSLKGVIPNIPVAQNFLTKDDEVLDWMVNFIRGKEEFKQLKGK